MVNVGPGRRAFVEALVGVCVGRGCSISPDVEPAGREGGRRIRPGERHHHAAGRRPHSRQGRDPGERWRTLHDRAADRAPWNWSAKALPRRARRVVLLPRRENIVVEIDNQRFRLGPGNSVLGPRRVPHAFVYDGAGSGRILIAFCTPAGRIEQFFRDLEKRGESLRQWLAGGQGAGAPAVQHGVVNVGPPLKL